MIQESESKDTSTTSSKKEQEQLASSRIQLRWRKHHQAKMSSESTSNTYETYVVGMHVEAIFEGKWHAGVVSSVYYEGKEVTGMAILFADDRVENSIRVADVRPAQEIHNVYSYVTSYAPTGKKWQREWNPIETPFSEIQIQDDTYLKEPKKMYRLRRTKSSNAAAALDKTDFVLDLRPLCSTCERCKKLSIYRCHSCSIVFYCSRICQRKDWPQHQIVCNPPLSRYSSYRAKEPFKPLFTDEDLERLCRGKTTVDAGVQTSSDGLTVDSATSMTDGMDFCPIDAEASKSSSLFETPVRQKKTSAGAAGKLAKVHPDVDVYKIDANIENINSLTFTGASIPDIKKALEVHRNDVNAAANWLLMPDGYNPEEYSDLPPLMSEGGPTTNTVSWNDDSREKASIEQNASTYGPPSLSEDGLTHRNGANMNGDRVVNPTAPPLHTEVGTNSFEDDDTKSVDSGTTVKIADIPRVEEIEEDSRDNPLVLSLCDMLGTSYEAAKEALDSFHDPNEAAEWMMLHPGEKPPPPRAAYMSPRNNSHPKHSQSRAPTPTQGANYDDLD